MGRALRRAHDAQARPIRGEWYSAIIEVAGRVGVQEPVCGGGAPPAADLVGAAPRRGGENGRNRFYNESRTLVSPYKSTPGVWHRQLALRMALKAAERVADPLLIN